MPKRAFAIAAHPDDIEFMMSGTLILLGRAGYELHYMTVANGSCGSERVAAAEIVRVRRCEAQTAAAYAGAVYHDSLVDDLEILYDLHLLRRLASVVRAVAPEVILTHWPSEYMEDHSNTCRLVCTAAFARGMQNFRTVPPQPTTNQSVTIYHALPYGLQEPLGRRVCPGLYVDVTGVMEEKREMLAAHRSQKEWLDASQGIGAYLEELQRTCSRVGLMSGRYTYAEGWTRRLHLGYCSPDADPLRSAIGDRCCEGGPPTE